MVAKGYAQRERQVPPPREDRYSPRFFDQLHRLYGSLSNKDLPRVFRAARPIQCSELARDKGEWQDVAFFSGNGKFGNWYRASIDEVTSSVASFVFESECGFQQAPLRLTTKFPVNEGPSHRDGTVVSQETAVKENPPVNVSFNIYTRAYDFDLPYLFYGKDETGGRIFTFSPRRLSDRYLTHVSSHWECKAATEEYLTYPFLVCHTTLLGYEPAEIKPDRISNTYSFGGSAYFILSNGKEVSSSF
jgi:hypothetical protein